jgi:hypothetical protein
LIVAPTVDLRVDIFAIMPALKEKTLHGALHDLLVSRVAFTPLHHVRHGRSGEGSHTTEGSLHKRSLKELEGRPVHRKRIVFSGRSVGHGKDVAAKRLNDGHVVGGQLGRSREDRVVSHERGVDFGPVFLGVNGEKCALVKPPVGEAIEKGGDKRPRTSAPTAEEKERSTEVPSNKVGFNDALGKVRIGMVGTNEANEIVLHFVFDGVVKSFEVTGANLTVSVAKVSGMKGTPL